MPTYQARFCCNPSLRRWRVLLGALLISIALAAGALGLPRSAQAATITVTTTTDEFNTGPNCSLREAIQSANTDTAFGGCTAGSGADTVTLGSGTFQITINPGPDENVNAAGDFDIASSLTIQGAGAGSTFVDGLGLDRVFDIAPNGGPAITVGFSGLTLQNGKGLATNFGVGGGMFINSNATVTINSSTLANNQSTTGTGGAIENRGALTLNTVTLQNNTALSLGGAVNNIGALTVNNSTFSGNKAESGGALYINTASTRTATISGSRFTGNQALATAGGADDSGGAIAINADGQVTISGSAFTGNSAAANGGAIYLNDSATEAAVAVLALSYSRITGNAAAGAGSGLYRASGSAAAQKNWWGCNAGPAAAPCNLVAGAAGFTPWIVLGHTASPTIINTSQSATLTAGFLQNSDGSANTAGSLSALAGVPVTFGSAVLGTLSAAQAAIQANGAATATYTAGASPGAGSAAATVDGATVTANLTINQPPSTTVTSLTRSGASPTNSPVVTWTVVFSDAVTGLAAANFSLAPSPGIVGASITGISGSGTNWTVTANAGGDGTVGLNLVNATGLDKPLTNLPFTGEVYTVDTTAPDTQIDSGPPTPSAGSSVTFTFSGTDAGAAVTTFQCSIDGAAYAACTSPQTYSGLANGSHTFQVRAVDAAGNVDPTPATYTWLVAVLVPDTTPPDTTIDSAPPDPSATGTVTFTFSGTDSGSGGSTASGIAGFECKLDAGAFAACISPQNYSGLAAGSHTFQVRAVDAAGNLDPTPATHTWAIIAGNTLQDRLYLPLLVHQE